MNGRRSSFPPFSGRNPTLITHNSANSSLSHMKFRLGINQPSAYTHPNFRFLSSPESGEKNPIAEKWKREMETSMQLLRIEVHKRFDAIFRLYAPSLPRRGFVTESLSGSVITGGQACHITLMTPFRESAEGKFRRFFVKIKYQRGCSIKSDRVRCHKSGDDAMHDAKNALNGSPSIGIPTHDVDSQ